MKRKNKFNWWWLALIIVPLTIGTIIKIIKQRKINNTPTSNNVGLGGLLPWPTDNTGVVGPKLSEKEKEEYTRLQRLRNNIGKLKANLLA